MSPLEFPLAVVVSAFVLVPVLVLVLVHPASTSTRASTTSLISNFM